MKLVAMKGQECHEARSDAESTVLGERSEPQSLSASGEEGPIRVHLRHTFLEMSAGSLMQRFRRMRKAQTEFLSGRRTSDPEIYEPGKATPVEEGDGEAEETASEAESEERRTVMLRNLPNNYTRDMLLKLLDEHGLKGRYDFVYLPCDFLRLANLGYAFVNLVDARAVKEVWHLFDGFSAWQLPSTKVCQVSWSGPHQGLVAHLERYRNSPVMHSRVPDEFKPALFAGGVRQPFPRPTRRLKLPRK